MSGVQLDNGTARVSGALTFETVPGFYAGTKAWLTGSGTLTVDLAAVDRVDSAGVALLLEWQAQARAAGRALTYANVPEQVQHMISVSGLAQAFAPG
jgi:phospholipid transport system transporter-binding protein